VRKYPAIAVIEFASIADGIYCTDALLKKAPIAMIKSGTVSNGRYLIIIGGSTASVDESLNETLIVGQPGIVDHVFLPDIHEKVHDAMFGARVPCDLDAVAILETNTVSANIRAAELAIKGTEVRLVELRLADYEMSGKAISVFNGELHEIQSAMDLAGGYLRNRHEYIKHRIIPRPHDVLAQHLTGGTRFAGAKPREFQGEEVS
jgi:microcompartment protein CcmL/EutN